MKVYGVFHLPPYEQTGFPAQLYVSRERAQKQIEEMFKAGVDHLRADPDSLTDEEIEKFVSEELEDYGVIEFNVVVD